MSKKGWVSIHRTILDHPLWSKERFSKGQAWMDLILNANHADQKIIQNNEFVIVKRGDQIRSIITLSNAWGWNPKTVRKFLKLLESDGMINVNSTHVTTTITICNYCSFQDANKNSTQPDGQPTTQPDGQAVPNHTDTNNNDNNVNNANNETKKENKAALSIANYLDKKIKENNPTANTKPKLWVKDIDRAMRIDKRTEQDLIEIIDFMYTGDKFWSSVILSGKKLRDKYDQMFAQKITKKQDIHNNFSDRQFRLPVFFC